MTEDLLDIKCMKTGTDYIILRIPRRVLKRLPDGYFYADIRLSDVKGGKKK